MALKSKGMPEKVDHYKTNTEKVRAKLASGARDQRWLSLKADDKVIGRIMPPWGPSAEGEWFFRSGLHPGFKIGGRDRMLACPEFHDKGYPCPVCMFLNAMDGSTEEGHSVISKRLKLKIRDTVNLLNRATEKIVMFGSGYTSSRILWTKDIQDQADENEYGDFTDPDEGHDISIKRVGSGMFDTKYTYRLLNKPSSIGLDDWKKKLHKLDEEVLEWMTYEEMVKHIKSNFGETINELGLKFPSVNGGKAKAKKKVEEEIEEETEVEESESDDDESDDELEEEDEEDNE